MNPRLQLFLQTLRDCGLSKTPERVYLFELLDTQKQPISMRNLISIAEPKLNRSTVYRTVDLFERNSIATRVYSGWKYKIELSDTFSSHHHHITCNKCGSTTSFHESEQLEQILEGVARANNFRLQNHTLELNGICAECR